MLHPEPQRPPQTFAILSTNALTRCPSSRAPRRLAPRAPRPKPEPERDLVRFSRARLIQSLRRISEKSQHFRTAFRERRSSRARPFFGSLRELRGCCCCYGLWRGEQVSRRASQTKTKTSSSLLPDHPVFVLALDPKHRSRCLPLRRAETDALSGTHSLHKFGWCER